MRNRPKLLLHACCAPCASYVIDYLVNYFDITIYFYNPNIMPEEEYQKRFLEIKRLANIYNVKVIEGAYDNNLYLDKAKGLEKEKEGKERCSICYLLRLEETSSFARLNGFDYFATTLTVSPYKNTLKINELGELLERKYEVKYLYSDFKKRDGYKKSIELSKKYNLYRQDYCGCVFSKINLELV